MEDHEKTREELLEELDRLRKRIAALEESETERRLAVEALRASERNAREIFDAANDAIFVHDVETGRILDVNVRMCETFGYTADEVRRLDVGGCPGEVEPVGGGADLIRAEDRSDGAGERPPLRVGRDRGTGVTVPTTGSSTGPRAPRSPRVPTWNVSKR